MLPEELEQVFGSVAQLYSRALSDGFRRLQPQVGPTCSLQYSASLCAGCQVSC